MTRLFCAAVFLVTYVTPAIAENDESTALDAAYKKQRDLYTKFRVAQKPVLNNAEVKKLREAWTAADAALKKTVESLSVKERKVEAAARDALNVAINRKIASSKDIADLNRKRTSLQKEVRDLRFEIGLISVRLNHHDSPLQQELDDDAGLNTLRKAMRTEAREERQAATTRYFAARRDKLKTLKGAKSLLAKTEKLNQEIAAATKQTYATSKAIFDVEQKIRYSKDKSLQPLRETLSATSAATRKLYSHPNTAKLRTASANASLAYRKHTKELIAANKDLTALQTQLDAISMEIRQRRDRAKPRKK